MGLFCPKCGSILMPKKVEGVSRMVCRCGYSSKGASAITEKVSAGRAVEVVEKEGSILPETAAECSRCGNNSAYFWMLQTRSADEPETKFLKCTKCGHTWRDYG